MKYNINPLIQSLVIRILHRSTADAFGVSAHPVSDLQGYAMFTQKQMEMIAEGDLNMVQERMYQNAYFMGALIRKILLIRGDERAKKVLFYLYRCIGMELQGDCPGIVQVNRCYFSNYYTPDMCRIMSAMDQGIFAGIFGYGTLCFTERITEGHACCMANFEKERTRTQSVEQKKTALVIGTGAGGTIAAKELQGDYQVTMLEIGKEFHPFPLSVKKLAALRKTGLFFDERLIRLLLPNMLIHKTKDMVLVRGKGLGGTTTLATGNAVRYDPDLQAIGIDLTPEYEQLESELPITTQHSKDWSNTTKRMYRIFQKAGLSPVITPKLLNPEKCINCGHCAIGCPTGAKWDTRALITEAIQVGADLVTGCKVEKLLIKDGRVTGVQAKVHGRKKLYQADVVIVAAGGMGTPTILENSGIPVQKTFFVDPVLCVAAPIKGYRQDRQMLMPFISAQDGYILAPYMDYLSFFFNKKWRYPMKDLVSIMIKLADEEKGSCIGKHIDKELTSKDKEILDRAVEQSRQILLSMGAREEDIFLGTLNAGHPGGMLPLTEAEKDTLHNDLLPENLYIADATILPKAMGNPPILTIMALAKRISGKLKH